MQASVDDAVARWCATHRNDVISDVCLWLGRADVLLGSIVFAAVFAVCATVWFRWWLPGARVALVLTAVSVLTGWLKPVFDRPRPPAHLALLDVTGYSMPSSIALMTSSILVAVVMNDWWPSKRLRRAALAVGVIGCVLIGAAMVYIGAHWLTDVLVGWAIGSVLTVVLVRAGRALERRMGRVSER